MKTTKHDPCDIRKGKMPDHMGGAKPHSGGGMKQHQPREGNKEGPLPKEYKRYYGGKK